MTELKENNNQDENEKQPFEFGLFELFSAAVALRIAHLPGQTEEELLAGRLMTVTDVVGKYELLMTASNDEQTQSRYMKLVTEMKSLLQEHLSDIEQLDQHHQCKISAYDENFFM